MILPGLSEFVVTFNWSFASDRLNYFLLTGKVKLADS
jgi:hypothetical protein